MKWTVESIEQLGTNDPIVFWRCENDGGAYVLGETPVPGLTMTVTTTEADVIAQVHAEMNAGPSHIQGLSMTAVIEQSVDGVSPRLIHEQGAVGLQLPWVIP